MTAQTRSHRTRAIKVWVDVDRGVAGLVLRLNRIPGVRTLASCQGSLGEGGAAPYGPYAMACWPSRAFARIAAHFDVELLGENWGYVRPKRRGKRTARYKTK